MNFLHHEQIYRGKDILDKIKVFPICICGAGAIGSNLAENLVRQGFRNLTVIDKDRIEDRNINTQTWTIRDIGSLKVHALKNMIFQICKVEIKIVPKEIQREKDLIRYLRRFPDFIGNVAVKDSFILIDAFDNSKSRNLIKNFYEKNLYPCLHIGFSGEYGEIIWNEDYQVPDDKGVDDCDYPLARNLILLLVAVASEVIIKFATKGIKENYTVTLKDFHIERYRP
ncbi:hypothetical protein ES705_43820 [subsurface metagenome]